MDRAERAAEVANEFNGADQQSESGPANTYARILLPAEFKERKRLWQGQGAATRQASQEQQGLFIPGPLPKTVLDDAHEHR